MALALGLSFHDSTLAGVCVHMCDECVTNVCVCHLATGLPPLCPGSRGHAEHLHKGQGTAMCIPVGSLIKQLWGWVGFLHPWPQIY